MTEIAGIQFKKHASRLLVFKGRLKEGVEDEYKEIHDNMPEELMKIYRDCGISDIRIYRTGRDMVLLSTMDADVDIETAITKAMQHSAMVRWMETTDVMFADDGKWVQLEEIFSFPPVT